MALQCTTTRSMHTRSHPHFPTHKVNCDDRHYSPGLANRVRCTDDDSLRKRTNVGHPMGITHSHSGSYKLGSVAKVGIRLGYELFSVVFNKRHTPQQCSRNVFIFSMFLSSQFISNNDAPGSGAVFSCFQNLSITPLKHSIDF